jgi:two-component system NtrC family sensor kinase
VVESYKGLDSARLTISDIRGWLAESAERLVNATASGCLVRGAHDFCVDSVTSSKEGLDAPVLLIHARAFADQAVLQGDTLAFQFSFRDHEAQKLYYGLAVPLKAAGTETALVVLRRNRFSSAESESITLLCSTAQLAMAKAQPASPASSDQESMAQMLELSSALRDAGDPEQFFHSFAGAATNFVDFEQCFVATVQPEGCYIQYGYRNGAPIQVQIDFLSTARRVLEQKQNLICEDISQLPVPEREQLIRWDQQARQCLAVPLLGAANEPLGVLAFLNKRSREPITPTDIERASALASHALIALEAARLQQDAETHKKRADDLMEMALDMGSALRLPEFVKNFTERVARMIGARCAVLALAQGSKVESVGFFGPRPDRELLRRLNVALSSFAVQHTDLKITGSGVQALGSQLTEALGWRNATLVRLDGTDSELMGILALADVPRELVTEDLNVLQAMIIHGSVALENSRLFTRITQSSRQWAEIFDSIADFIVVHDDQHQVLKVNRSLAEFIGVRPAELIGLKMRALSAITSDSPYPCPFCHEQVGSDEYVHPVLERSYLVSTSKINGALDEGFQTVHVLRDITDRREAERRYRELFDNVQEGVFFASPEGHFIEVNDALVRMLGYESRDDVLKIDLNKQVYISPEQRDEISRRLKRDGTIRNFEVALCRKDGSIIYALENTFVVRDTQGRIMQYRGVFLDITEAKNFQAQLQRERDFTGKILNNTQTMIMVADTAGLVSYANRRSYEAGGFEQDELVGHRLARIVLSSHQAALAEGFETALQGMQVDNLELLIARGDGTQGKFSVNLSPMRDEAGDVTSVVVLMTDITDAAMIQAKLMHTEKMAAVGQLVSGVAHEVNNPLTAIMGFSDLLMENPELPGSARKDLQVILEEAQRTKEIVQNLLSFARQRPPQRQRLQINDILRKTIVLRAYDFANHGVQVLENFDETLPELIGDSHQLQQVFLNILNNAYDAVQAAARPGLIEIETTQDNGWVEILFRDNGEGIQHPERIFDPFFTTKEVGQGTGLGLSICYGIVREHEGEILCANNPDMSGATFSVRLPIRNKSELKVISMAGARS